MKKLGIIGMTLMLAALAGCQSNTSSTVEVTAVETPSATPSENQEEAQVQKFTEKDFEGLFKAYFSFDENTLLTLNQNRPSTDEAYWENLNFYKQEINDKIGHYLSASLKQTMGKQYTIEEIDLPKKISINNYMAYASGQVEKVEINSTRMLGNSAIYEVAVTTVNKVQPMQEFASQYTWDEEKGYYTHGTSLTATSTQTDDESTKNVFGYMYADGTGAEKLDEVKLIQRFWVQVEADADKIQVEKIEAASTLQTAIDNKNKRLDIQNVTRIPYTEEVSNIQRKLMVDFFSILMNAPESTYTYYEKAYDTNLSSFQGFWKNLGFDTKLSMDEKGYKEAFPLSINPYKDSIAELTLNNEQIQIISSVYSTKLQPRFIVILPVKALLKNNDVVYYNYRYYVGLENGKIELVRFMQMDEIDEVVYETGEEAPVEGEEGAEAASEEETAELGSELPVS